MHPIQVVDQRTDFCGTNPAKSPEARAEELLQLLASASSVEYLGELTLLEHCLQAAELAQQSHADQEVILASLFHAIGHLCTPLASDEMSDVSAIAHEELGARCLLNMGLSERVAELIRGHVQAKRYLAVKEEGFLESLSESSLEILKHRGGPMTAEEAKAFEQDAGFHDKLLIRRCDDGAQLTGWPVPGLESHRQSLLEHLQRQG